MAAELAFDSPHTVRDCIDRLHSHQRMPTAGSFGFWIDVEEAADTRADVSVKLLFGSNAFRPIAWYTVTLETADGGTRVHIVMTDFNYTMAAGFAVVSIAGAVIVLLSQVGTGGTIALLVLFMGFGAFGYFFTRAQHSDAERLPAAMQEWLQ